MASERGVPDAGNEPVPRSGDRPSPRTRPFYAEPSSLAGWAVALLALLVFWWYYVRRPTPGPGEPIARLTAVEGRVRVRASGGEAWKEARLSEVLRVGDVVQTEARAGAEISFDTGSVVRVRPDTVVHIGGSAEASTAAWRVRSGHVNFAIADQPTEILTPTARTTALRDAAGNIDVAETGETGLRLFRGQARLETSQGQRVTLSENQAVQVDAAGRAGATRSLPPPPTLTAPLPKAALPFAAPPDPVARLAWNGVPRAGSYHVAVDFNVTQANLLLSAALDVPDVRATTHDLAGVAPGRYFWRVAAVTEDGLEGAFSRVSLFTVLPEPPPPASVDAAKLALVIEEAVAVGPGVVHLGGRTQPGATVTVDGTAIAVMADGSFSEYLRRRAGGAVVVRSRGRDGRVTERTRAIARP